MIRTCLAVAALLLSACSPSKPEDMTARYAREGQPALVAMTAANGDARVAAGETLFLRKGGQEYIVLHDAAGSFSARIDDALAVFAEDKSGLMASNGPRPQPQYALSEAGSESVAGVKGKVWKGHPRDVPSLTSFEGVVSGDPALAPLGQALAMQTRFAVLRNSADFGGPGNFEKAMLDLFGKGAVLRFNTILKLEKIDKAPIPATIFALPEPLLGRDALRARLRKPAKE
ncbi:MAG: hypothetical protein KF730_01130 [Sphingomonas sp.]|uniref:hypothetical protein n=1 Tax=Sphingomonas sp. TaxID=28214 RepID=UPI0025D89349|nr:hypothetical protein [Sphingomonas sp.]MBX3563155.1 hypothetical protein [Sphingomonas sp.]